MLLYQALLASRSTVGGAKKDEHTRLTCSTDILRMFEEIKTLRKENEALGNLRVSLKSENEHLKEKVAEQGETIKKMQEKMDLVEGVLENLRNTIEQDDRKMTNLKTEVHQLKADVEKYNDVISKLEKEAEEDHVVWDL